MMLGSFKARFVYKLQQSIHNFCRYRSRNVNLMYSVVCMVCNTRVSRSDQTRWLTLASPTPILKPVVNSNDTY